jgi:hypothetical protein
MKLTQCFFALLFAVTALGADSLAGSWINTNPDTSGVTRLAIRSTDQQQFVHAWGACHPSDCDWGEVQCLPHGGACQATWDHGFAATSMQLLPLADGRLQIKYKFEFHDKSGRRDLGHEELFARGEPPQVTRPPIRNLTPEEAAKRILQCPLPRYPDSRVRPLLAGTVDIGLIISTSGDVTEGTRFLHGPTFFRDSAMQAVFAWKFEPDPDQAHPTLGRVRALIRYKADMSTEVALAPAILSDAFGDRGTPRNEEAEAALPPMQCGN